MEYKVEINGSKIEETSEKPPNLSRNNKDRDINVHDLLRPFGKFDMYLGRGPVA